MPKLLAVVAVACTLLLWGGVVASEPTQDAPQPGSRPGELVPDIALAMLGDDPIRLTDLCARKVVVLTFWESWCRECRLKLRMLDSLASNYKSPEVALIAVNVQEDKATVRRFVSENKLNLPVALDRDGSAGKAFGAEELPMVVLIDKGGILRTIHEGYDYRLASKLLDDFDTIFGGHDVNASGKDFSPGNVTADKPDRSVETLTTARRFSSTPIHEEEDFVIELESGETLDLRAVFTEQGREFEEKLHRLSNHRNATRTKYGDGSIIFMRLGTRLHGPTAAYYKNKSPMIYLDYEKGKRTGTLFTWDEQERPWVFAQYKSGRKQGLSVVFRACSDACTTGHVWLVQEWQRGKLQKSHLVGESATPLTLDHTEGTNIENNEAYTIALAHLEEFESQLDMGEEELRVEVARYGAQEARARRAARTARVQASIQPRGFAVSTVPVRRCSSGAG